MTAGGAANGRRTALSVLSALSVCSPAVGCEEQMRVTMPGFEGAFELQRLGDEIAMKVVKGAKGPCDCAYVFNLKGFR